MKPCFESQIPLHHALFRSCLANLKPGFRFLRDIFSRTMTFALAGSVALNVAGCFPMPPPAGLPSEFAQPAPKLASETNHKGFDRHLVVVRIPVGVDQADARAITNRFVDGNYMSGQCATDAQGRRDTSDRCTKINGRALSRSISETAYYGAEFYDLLQTALPETDVVLQPTILGMRDKSTIEARSIVELPPATVVVDFMIYKDPEGWASSGPTCNNYAYWLCAVVAIRTHPTASPQTGGALAGLETLTWALQSGQAVASDAQVGKGATIVELLNASDEAYRAGSKRLKPLPKAVLVNHRPLIANKYVEFPYQAVRTPISLEQRGYLRGMDELGPFVAAVAEAVQAISPSLGLGEGLVYYAGFYDSGLATRIKNANMAPSDRALVETLGKFRDAEVAFLNKQDEALIKNLTLGALGQSVYAEHHKELQEYLAMLRMVAAQYQASAAQMSALVPVVASTATARYAAKTHDTALLTQANSQMLTAVTQYSALLNEQFKSMNPDFAESYATVNLQQYDVVLSVVGNEEMVRSGSLAELREKFKAIYKRVKQTP